MPLEDVIGANLGALFPGMEVVRFFVFRVTRYSDIELANAEEPEDLLEAIEEQVFQRRFGEVVRLEVEEGMPDAVCALLLEELREETPGRPASQRAGRAVVGTAAGVRRPDAAAAARLSGTARSAVRAGDTGGASR